MNEPLPFGQRLQNLLENLHPPRSQAWLADVTGLERSTISRLIRGERNPTFETVQCLAPVLGVSVDELVGGTDAASRINEASQLVRRQDYEAAVKALAEYEGRINDLEAKLRAATNAREQEESLRKQEKANLEVVQSRFERLERSLAEVNERNGSLERELRRYREALHRAATEVSILRGKLDAAAEELKATSKSSRTAALLAGIAAFTGVVTAASFLGSSDEASNKKASEESSKQKSRNKSNGRQV